MSEVKKDANERINCTMCAMHKVLPDPDPDDWFCDDDVKVKCTAAKDQTPKYTALGHLKSGEPYVTVACRPYMVKKECDIPEWCPFGGPVDSHGEKINLGG